MSYRPFCAHRSAFLVALACLFALTSALTPTVFAPDGARVTNISGAVNQSNFVRVPLAAGFAHDVLFEPIELNPGDAYSLDWVDAAGASIGRYELRQVDESTTDLYLHLDGNWPDVARNVAVTTEHNGRITGTAMHPAAKSVYIGSVTAPTTAWAETYHVECGADGCELVVDPPNTTIDLAGGDISGNSSSTTSGHTAIPFHLIKAKFMVDPARLEGETSLVLRRSYPANIAASLSTVR